METTMLKLNAFNKVTLESKDISERDLDDYDNRVWDISIQENKKRDIPLCNLKVVNKSKKGFEYMPFYNFEDLDKLFISKTGNLTLKSALTKKQVIWNDMQKRSIQMFGTT